MPIGIVAWSDKRRSGIRCLVEETIYGLEDFSKYAIVRTGGEEKAYWHISYHRSITGARSSVLEIYPPGITEEIFFRLDEIEFRKGKRQ